MGLLSCMRSVVGRNVVMRRIPVLATRTVQSDDQNSRQPFKITASSIEVIKRCLVLRLVALFCHFQREELAPVPIRLTRTCYTLLRKMSDLISNLKTSGNTSTLYRVIQEGSAILWEMIVCVILSKKVHMNMGPILNGYRDMVKRRYGPSCEHEQQLRNK